MKKIYKLIIFVVLAGLLVVLTMLAAKNQGDTSTKSISGVIINEAMSKNDTSCPDEHGNFYDWIELYNTGSKSADLSGCGLSDNITDPVKYVFPKNTIIEAGGYLVVYCAGDASLGEFYADFKLSASDNIVLYNQGGNPIECIELRQVGEGKTLSRNPGAQNEWLEMLPSPGFANTEEGVRQYAESLKNRTPAENTGNNENSPLIINELMAQNATTLRAKDGCFYDWAEIYNKSDKTVNLKGYFVSDDISKPDKYTFTDDIEIAPESYLIIFCSGQSGVIEGEVHVPFGLSAYEEAFVISDENGVKLDSVTYQHLKADISYARDDGGNFAENDKPTPGYPNTQSGYEEFIKTAYAPASDLIISEMMGLNTGVTIASLSSESDPFPDFIEIYNSGDKSINLKGYGLTNNPKNPAKWTFPDIAINSGEYLKVLATSSKASYSLSTGFGINSDGDTVYLFDPDGNFLDKLRADSFINNMSVGRNSKNEVLYYGTPTPGSKNAQSGYSGLTTMPVFDVTPGIYDEKQKVTISCADNETIYYTTDCTTPTKASKQYKGAIEVDKNTVIRAKTFRDGYFNDFSCASATYLFTYDDCNHSLPVVTLVTDPDNLWNEETGIYSYGNHIDVDNDVWPYATGPDPSKWANFWQDREAPACFGLYDESGKQVFTQNVGISISGAFGQGREQKGFAVTARNEYGSNRLKYKFFKDLDYTEYKSILLRCGAQDQANGKIRDVLAAGLLKGSDVNFLYQDYEPRILYLNGRYWGVYFLREKRNRFFVAQHEGLGLDNADNMDLIKSETRANYGTTAEWAQVMNYARTHDLTVDSNYKYVTDRIDMDSFIDYMICEIYVGNTDYWNMQMYKLDGGKWRFIYYDFCWGFNNVEHQTVNARRQSAQPGSDLFNACLKRSDFKDKFCRRFASLMDTVFEKDRVLKLIDELYNQVEPEIKRERSLFNTKDSPYFSFVSPANYSTYERFISQIEMIKNFAEKRRPIIVSQLKSELGLSSEYVKEVFGE